MQQEENNTNVIFAGELRALMQKHGHNQVALAEALNVRQSAISNYLKGRVPRAAILQHIAQFYDVLEDQLLNGGAVVGSRSKAWRSANPKGEVLRGPPGKALTSFTGPSELEHWRDKAVVAERKVERLKKMLQEALAEL